jgi:polyisoprenyl-phosphate glycosyltransferase
MSGTHLTDRPARSREPDAQRRRKLCSVIVPVYNEYDNLLPLYTALCAATETEPEFDWEFLFIEDGSTDNSFFVAWRACHY